MLRIQLIETPDVLAEWLDGLCQANALEWQNVSEKPDLVIADERSLNQLSPSVMTMVITEKSHLSRIQVQLCQLCLAAWLDRNRLKATFEQAFRLFLDYYYMQYHIGQVGRIDVFLDEVYYFEKKDDETVKAVTKKGTFFFKADMHQLQRRLPHDFFHLDDQHSFHLAWATKTQDGHWRMPDDSEFISHRSLTEMGTPSPVQLVLPLELGDHFSVSEIKEAKKKSVLFLLAGWCLLAVILVRFVLLLWIWGVITLVYGLAAVLLYRIFFLNALHFTGNYFRLDVEGMDYCEPLTLSERYIWVKAQEKGQQDDLMSHLDYRDIRYVELVTRRSMNTASGMFGYVNDRNYRLELQIETPLGTLSLMDQVHIFGEAASDQLRLASNWFYLLGIRQEGEESYRLVLNDPKSTINQYMQSRQMSRNDT